MAAANDNASQFMNARELMEEFGRGIGKDLSELIQTIQVNDIETVEDLTRLSENDLRELGFTIGIKNKF